MRANFRMQRLFVSSDIVGGVGIEANADQFNYLANVLQVGRRRGHPGLQRPRRRVGGKHLLSEPQARSC